MKLVDDKQVLDVIDCDLSGSRFNDVNLASALFDDVDLTGARFHDTKLRDVVIDQSCIAGMRINGVLVSDLLATYEAARTAGGE